MKESLRNHAIDKRSFLNLAARWRDNVKGRCPASDEECATCGHNDQRSKESEGRTNYGPPPNTHDEPNDSEDVVKNCLRHTVYSIAVMTVATCNQAKASFIRYCY